MDKNSDLLEPVLTKDSAEPIFSVTALFFSAFIGGAIATAIMGLFNIEKAKGSPIQYVYVLLAVALFIGSIYWFTSVQPLDNRAIRLINTGCGFAFMGMMYLIHRREYRSMEVMGIEPPSPVKAVACACIVGILSIGQLTWSFS